MTVLIDDRSNNAIACDFFETIEKVAEVSLQYEEFEQACEISVSIVTDEEIQSINKEFRGIDKATDVLSFPQLSFSEDEVAGVNENDEIVLGDIIISLERAKEQAAEYAHSLKREIAFLTAHSMLHLLGYDHMNTDEEAVMNGKQKEILEGMGIFRE